MGEILLTDNRRLAYRDYGDPDGHPCLYTPGWPSSGLLGSLYGDTARAAGVRLLAVDKPGSGGSDPDPYASLPRFGADAVELVDQLGLDSLSVFGESGGGPYALAIAAAVPDRVRQVVLAASFGPDADPSEMNPMIGQLVTLARTDPEALQRQFAGLDHWLSVDPAQFEQGFLASLPPEVTAGLDTSVLVPATREALREEGRWAAQGFGLLVQPWGFELSTVDVPVRVWHGTADDSAPLSAARTVIDALPRCTAHILEGEGHSIGLVHREQILQKVLARQG
ncbi:alpha/beta hydrolase [Pseudonocardiaceae bacterium YIM PH 21723]|nr:alpha/beta hydrolase [Pseudonocardiaceae bacterium YIM PH 21723]